MTVRATRYGEVLTQKSRFIQPAPVVTQTQRSMLREGEYDAPALFVVGRGTTADRPAACEALLGGIWFYTYGLGGKTGDVVGSKTQVQVCVYRRPGSAAGVYEWRGLTMEADDQGTDGALTTPTPWSSFIERGTYDDRPAASAYNVGTFYYAVADTDKTIPGELSFCVQNGDGSYMWIGLGSGV